MTPPARDAVSLTQWRRTTEAKCGEQVYNVCQSSPSMYRKFVVVLPSYCSFPLAKRLVHPPHGFLSHWVFAVFPPHHTVLFYPNGFFLCRLVVSPTFFPVFFQALTEAPYEASKCKKPAAFGAEPSPPKFCIVCVIYSLLFTLGGSFSFFFLFFP